MKIETINKRRQPGYFPYYKIQVWDNHNQAWHDIQRRFATPVAAHSQASSLVSQGDHYRLMEVQKNYRAPVP